MTADDVVLITGYPSQLAREVCAETTRADPGATVRALVPTGRADRARLAIDRLPEAQRRRVSLVEGDAWAIDLCLSGAEVRSLSAEVTRIHHYAAVLAS